MVSLFCLLLKPCRNLWSFCLAKSGNLEIVSRIMIWHRCPNSNSGNLEIWKSRFLARVSAQSSNNLATKIWKKCVWHNLRSHLVLMTQINGLFCDTERPVLSLNYYLCTILGTCLGRKRLLEILVGYSGACFCFLWPPLPSGIGCVGSWCLFSDLRDTPKQNRFRL